MPQRGARKPRKKQELLLLGVVLLHQQLHDLDHDNGQNLHTAPFPIDGRSGLRRAARDACLTPVGTACRPTSSTSNRIADIAVKHTLKTRCGAPKACHWRAGARDIAIGLELAGAGFGSGLPPQGVEAISQASLPASPPSSAVIGTFNSRATLGRLYVQPSTFQVGGESPPSRKVCRARTTTPGLLRITGVCG